MKTAPEAAIGITTKTEHYNQSKPTSLATSVPSQFARSGKDDLKDDYVTCRKPLKEFTESWCWNSKIYLLKDLGLLF